MQERSSLKEERDAAFKAAVRAEEDLALAKRRIAELEAGTQVGAARARTGSTAMHQGGHQAARSGPLCHHGAIMVPRWHDAATSGAVMSSCCAMLCRVVQALLDVLSAAKTEFHDMFGNSLLELSCCAMLCCAVLCRPTCQSCTLPR